MDGLNTYIVDAYLFIHSFIHIRLKNVDKSQRITWYTVMYAKVEKER